MLEISEFLGIGPIGFNMLPSERDKQKPQRGSRLQIRGCTRASMKTVRMAMRGSVAGLLGSQLLSLSGLADLCGLM